MLQTSRKLRILSGCLLGFSLASELFIGFNLKAEVATASTPLVQFAQTTTGKKEERKYEKAEAELPEDVYVIYRIIDRLVRANNLEAPYWRIIINPDYSPVAYVTQAPYLINLHQGILEITEGDASALAWVIAHEIAHQVHRHSAKLAKIQEEISQKMQESMTESEDFGEIFGELMKQSPELARQLEEASEAFEQEANETAYLYVVRAGFEPEGGKRVFELFHQFPSNLAEEEADPKLSEYIEAIENMKKNYPPETLQEEGKARIEVAKALTYEFEESERLRTLKVKAKPKRSSLEDIHRLFGR